MALAFSILLVAVTAAPLASAHACTDGTSWCAVHNLSHFPGNTAFHVIDWAYATYYCIAFSPINGWIGCLT